VGAECAAVFGQIEVLIGKDRQRSIKIQRGHYHHEDDG
jgi:hypothetical protein